MQEARVLEVEMNPYGTDIILVLEDEICELMKDVDTHKIMAKTAGGSSHHSKQLKVKQRLIERLLAQHPDGEEFLYDL